MVVTLRKELPLLEEDMVVISEIGVKCHDLASSLARSERWGITQCQDHWMNLHKVVLNLAFAGPVRWTGKKTEIELNPTAKDWTTSCGCTNSEFFWLPVAMFVKKSKNQRENRSFVPSCVGPYSRTLFPNCRSLNHKKRSRIGWDIAKNTFICNSNVCPFCFHHISAKS